MEHQTPNSAVQQTKNSNAETALSTKCTTITTISDNEITLSFSEPPATKDEVKQFTLAVVSLCGRNKVDETGTLLLANIIRRHSIPATALNAVVETLYTTPIYSLNDITRLLLGTIPHLHIYTRDEIYRITGQYPSPDYPLCQLPDGTQALLRLQDAQLHHIPILKDYREFA